MNTVEAGFPKQTPIGALGIPVDEVTPASSARACRDRNNFGRGDHSAGEFRKMMP
jgi:hypothetical protein